MNGKQWLTGGKTPKNKNTASCIKKWIVVMSLICIKLIKNQNRPTETCEMHHFYKWTGLSLFFV